MSRLVEASFFARDTLDVARRLIGATLTYRGCSGVIVETEAYKDDAASHFVTRRHSARLMLDTHGHVYVYRIYGMHCCLNFTTERGAAGAVLLRALQPVDGLATMRRRRGVSDVRQLCSGPGKLAQALGVKPALTGQPVLEHFELQLGAAAAAIVATPRIGISQACELPWRFVLRDTPFASRGGLSRRPGAE